MKIRNRYLRGFRNHTILTLILSFIIFLIPFNVLSQVIEEWVARYNGTGNGWDEAYAIAIDGLGNVYVTGGSYDSGTERDYATIKYNSTGIEQWLARYNGPGNDYDWANAIAVDNSGNVYVTGLSYGGSGTQYDYATIKYNSAGIEQWVARYNGLGNSDDSAWAITLDSSGYIYVTGESNNLGAYPYDSDYATIKYNSAGIEQWVAKYNGSGNDYDVANAIAVDSSGNVYVTGHSDGLGLTNEYATIKYDSEGVEQWVAKYGGNNANAIVVDISGNVYVTGCSTCLTTIDDYATIKYNSAGIRQWVARYNGSGNGFDCAYAIALDSSGNVYVTGRSEGSGTDFDYTTIKYNSAGVEQWVTRYNSSGNGKDSAYAMALDSSGNIYVTGESYSLGTELDYATVKYDSAGTEQWIARYNGPGSDEDWASSITVDSSGNVYVTGRSVGSGTGNDYATIKYSQGAFSEDFYLY